MARQKAIVTVFRSRVNPAALEEYARLAGRMSELARQMPGYKSHKGFVAEDGERLTLVEFESESAQRAWSLHAEHVQAKKRGRSGLYLEYRVQVCTVQRDSGFIARTDIQRKETMTPRQIELVQQSWKSVLPIADAAAEMFYAKLFELDPALKALFKGDLKQQGRKLMQMISTAVGGLARVEALVPAVQDLGRRHGSYGVKDKDYDTVAAALLWTLGRGLGAAFTSETKDAWVAVYGILASAMKGAAVENRGQVPISGISAIAM